MFTVPTLPKETAYLYARFNMIKKISGGDFADIGEFSFLHKRKHDSVSRVTHINLMLPISLWQVIIYSVH